MGLIVDNFAGGGGASTGIEAAIGKPIDIAINHDEAAIAVHKANHPDTKHYCQSIYSVDPLEASGGAPVALAWFSPDCKHHSKAKGGRPREKYIRDMADVVPHWIERLKKGTLGGEGMPKVIMLENVEEFRQWGPLNDDGFPIKERAGETFNAWVRRIRRSGYNVEWKELRACDYGAPTKRKRLFLIARCDGRAIVWPAPTHGRPDSAEVRSGKLLPWEIVADCIDWTLEIPSIFGRKIPLKDATNRRIAAGIVRYVIEPSLRGARPFIVPVTNTGWNPDRTVDTDEPLPTVMTSKGGEYAAVDAEVAPLLTGVGGRRAQSPPLPVNGPSPTATTKADAAVVAASMIKLRNNAPGSSPKAPVDTISAEGKHHGIAAASMVQLGYGERKGQKPRTLNIEGPAGTVVAGGRKQGLVVSFLHKYHPGSVGADMGEPGPTATANSFVKRGGGAPPISVVAAHMHQANTGVVGHDMRKPASTIVGKGCTQQPVTTTLVAEDALPPEMLERAVQVHAFLIKYYGSEIGQHQPVDVGIDVITAKARFAVVTVVIDSVAYVIVDIGMRMLTPRELANAQGFPRSYILDPVCWYWTDPSKKYPQGRRKYGRLPKAQQIAKIGNSVCPQMSEALVRANLPEYCDERLAA